MRAITDLYMNESSVGYAYSKTSKFCDSAENIPCWVPQIKDILDPEKSKLLKKCPTVWDFTCETNFLVYAWKYGPSMCPKPCKNWRFKSNDAGSSKMASYLGANVNYVMSFASDIVLKEEERKVKAPMANYHIDICTTISFPTGYGCANHCWICGRISWALPWILMPLLSSNDTQENLYKS